MKLINKFLIVILILGIYVIFEPIKADNLSGTGGVGSAGSGTTTGKSGSWNKYANGFYIAAYNTENQQKGDTITFVNCNSSNCTAEIPGWINSSNNSTDPTKLYDYLNIPYGDTSGNYAMLKELISSINLEEGDYIIIEPFTKIGGKWNTFRSIISNESKDTYINSENKEVQSTFYSWYYRAAVLMANAAKVGIDITVGGHTYTAPSNNCTKSRYNDTGNNKFCGWKGNSYIGYGLVIVKYEDMYPKLTVRYHSNGATVRKYQNKTITEKELYDNYPSTFEYSKSYPNGLRDGNNPDYLYLTQTGYTFTGNWLIGSAYSTNKISQSFSGTGEEIAEKLGITDFSIDHTVDVYAEWAPEQSPKLDINICVDGGDPAGTPKWSGFTDVYGTFDFKLGGNYVKYSDGVDWIGKMKDYDKKSPYNTEYILENITAGDGYTYIGASVRDRGSCTPTTTSNKIEENLISDTSITLLFQSECKAKLENIKSLKNVNMNQYISGLFNLYRDELVKGNNYRNLLNIADPTCTVKDPPSKEINNLVCLSGSTLSNANFTEKNLSQYSSDEFMADANGNYIGFCLESFYLKNNLGAQTFYSKSGQFLVKEIEEKINGVSYKELQIFNSKYKPIRSCGNKVATATVKKTCYVLSDHTFVYEDNMIGEVNVYFGDNDGKYGADSLPLINNSDEVITKRETTTNSSLTRYEFTREFVFGLKDVPLEKITGKTFPESSNNGEKTIVKGVISKFNETEGTIPFKVTYDGETYGQDKSLCKYKTEPEIIKKDELELEYRIIDTINPFNRKTMSNWSDGMDNSKDNDVVKKYIINATNSYGMKEGSKQSPIYKIQLTPTDIKNIREYNNNVPYDNYEKTCKTIEDGSEVCSNTFLTNLTNGKVIITDNDGNVVKTLLGSKLETTQNLQNTPTNSVNEITEVNGVTINKKICTKQSTNTSGKVVIEGKDYRIGDEYECEVSSNAKYIFYVVGACGENKINMIMKNNLNNVENNSMLKSAWFSGHDYFKIIENPTLEYNNLWSDGWSFRGGNVDGWCDEETVACENGTVFNVFGPVTALTALNSATAGWSNIVTHDYTLLDEFNNFSTFYKNLGRVPEDKLHPFGNDPDVEKYSPIEVYDSKARLLTRNEASDCGCTRYIWGYTDDHYCPSFIWNTNNKQPFWLSDSGDDYDKPSDPKWQYTGGADITLDGGDTSYVPRTDAHGIRPVITVYTSQIRN